MSASRGCDAVDAVERRWLAGGSARRVQLPHADSPWTSSIGRHLCRYGDDSPYGRTRYC